MNDTWTKSSKCDGGTCAEVLELPNGNMALRNSINPEIVLTFTPAEWDAFIGGVHNGEFDRMSA